MKLEMKKKKTDMLPSFKFAFYCQTSIRLHSSKITRHNLATIHESYVI